jgi:hypothetical protein
MAPDSVYAALGFRVDDIIHSVNVFAITDLESQLNAYYRLTDAVAVRPVLRRVR